MKKHLPAMALGLFWACCSLEKASAASWTAQPLEVHEWGVNSYDWGGKPLPPANLPAFYCTPQSGEALIKDPGAGNRARDLPADNGIREKPVLYFYSSTNRVPEKGIPLDAEVSFRWGEASAWYPTATLVRTAKETANAIPLEMPKSAVGFLGAADGKPSRPVPMDGSFQLVWNGLRLTKDIPPGMKLETKGLDNGHWVNAARKPEALYVNNGREAERYLFYEGRTHERSALSLAGGTQWKGPGFGFSNTGHHPVYDVLFIYNHGGKHCVKYHPVLESAVKDKPAPILLIPDFEGLPAMDEAAFKRETRDKLFAAMTEGAVAEAQYDLRDPAQWQAPCVTHVLYPDEANAVLDIWSRDFFDNEGLTILYRESPAYLDEAMPLHLFTDMFHKVEVSRCGWVVNRNVPTLPVIQKTREALGMACCEQQPARDDARRICRENRHTALMLLKTWKFISKDYEAFRQELEKMDEKK